MDQVPNGADCKETQVLRHSKTVLLMEVIKQIKATEGIILSLLKAILRNRPRGLSLYRNREIEIRHHSQVKN